MNDVIIYHNPRCSKSRATLALLREKGIEPDVVEYLKNPPDENDLARILGMLELEPIELIRNGEVEYTELGLEEKKDDSGELIRQMIAHPILIERPIVVRGNRARIGRPPENVLEIL
ncbi:MAG: arsenate reductase (glutaredoxin) [Candidatus Latescibacteria bacterium]|nr:arsenate reductase (glutaredoxin) [Candidatus Latescibacterota bacterium]MBT4137908.1 arsenate reductase (glutaredoxin) [Candidatus Latescibacterota bacterium]MBT5828974.1 arsenate reductase (glutaredoxin) [Candidatus Latescibacterota bacterium]